MDADTFVNPEALKKMVVFFGNSEVMSVTPSMGITHPRNLWERIQQIEYYVGVFLRKAFATVNAIHITPGAFSAYRKKFFDKYGGYEEGNITEDLEIALRIQHHGYVIENAEDAAIYTVAPRTFKGMLFQRRRWYVGLMKNLWKYRTLFGLKKGPLGTLILPVAVITVLLSIALTIYVVFKTLSDLASGLAYLKSVNFQFANTFELSFYVIENFFYSLFSNPLFLVSFVFVIILAFYLYFARRKMKFSEGVIFNFVLFIVVYTFLFTFWWIVSILYVMFNRKVAWRENKR